MTYADPLHCPSCGAPATGAERCPRCGLLLRGERPLRLLGLLADADRLLAEMRAEAAAWSARSAAAQRAPWPPTPPVPAYTGGPTSYAAPPVGVPAAPRPRWSVGGTLLALGALCLVVAGLVFVAVGWGSLGLTGRTLCLVALTVAVGGAAAWVTTRRLRASAEALWTAFGLLAAVDVGAGRSAGVLGLDALGTDVVVLLFSSLLALGSLVVALAVRRWIVRLVAAEIGLVIGLVTGVIAALAVLPVDLRWTSTVAVAGLVLATLGLVRLRLPVAAWPVGLCSLGALVLTTGILATGVALDEADDRWRQGDAPALLLLGAVTLGLAVLVARALTARGHTGLALLAKAVGGVVATFSLVVVALLVRGVSIEVATLTWCLVPLVTACVGARFTTPGWSTGVRVALVPAALPLVGAILATAGAAVLGVSRSWLPGWEHDVSVRFTTDWSDPVWLVAAAWFGAAAVLAVVACWPPVVRTAAVRTAAWLAVALLLVLGVAVVGVVLEAPVLVVALVMLLVAGAGALLGVVRHGRGDLALAGACAAAVATAVAVLLPLGSAPAAAAVWCVAAVLAALVTVAVLSDGRRDVGALAGGAAAALAVAGILAWVDVAGAGSRGGALAAVAVAVVLLALASLPGLSRALRVPWEVVAGLTACVSLVEASDTSLGWLSLCLTVLGAAAVGVGLLRRDRRPYAVGGSAVLGLAYVTRLVASDIGVVEAYTMPFGILLLAAGVVRMVTDPRRSSSALLPGLGLVLLPSLPGALVDPTSLRGLLLALAGVVALAAGAIVRQKAPFHVGAALTTLLALRWAGPLVGDLPWWIPLGTVGLVLLLAGATWEARVRDARAAVSYVRGLR